MLEPSFVTKKNYTIRVGYTGVFEKLEMLDKFYPDKSRQAKSI